MTALALRWRVPDRPVVTRWRGPEGVLQAVARYPEAPIATIIGPPGATGSAGDVQQFNQSSAGTWIIPHGMGRAPIVQVFMASGEQILSDVTVDTINITVTFASPQAGFVLAA